MYSFYIKFLNIYSRRYTLVIGDNEFSRYLKETGIRSKIFDINGQKTFDSCKEIYSAIAILNVNSYFNLSELEDLIKKSRKKLEQNGIILIELPDFLINEKTICTPEFLECLCKEYGYRKTRIFKTPLGEDGLSFYLVTAKNG